MVHQKDDNAEICPNIEYVVYLHSCVHAPVSQLVEEAASKSAQCGFESHRGHVTKSNQSWPGLGMFSQVQLRVVTQLKETDMDEKKTTEVNEVLTEEELKAVAAPEQSDQENESRKRTVVVAEDESVNRMDLVAMLEDNGYEVVGEAANGEEAVDLTRKFRPNVVCMDVKMPRMDGIEAAGIICDENIAPVVMLTAFSQSDLVKKATGAGAMAYVTKPYEESKLLPALEVAMGRFAEINDLLDNVERSENKLHETEEQLRKTEEQLKKAEETLEERKLVDRAKGLLMDKADFSEQGAFRWIQKTSMDQRIPKKRLAMAIIAKYGEQKSEAEDER